MATPVSYIIYLTDAARVALLQAQYPTGIQIPPQTAALLYGVPVATNPNAVGCVAVYPADSIEFDVNLFSSYGSQSFTITYPSAAAPPAGFPNPYPSSVSCYWVGYFRLTGAVGTTPPGGTPRYLGARRWADGFEIPTVGENGAGSISTRLSRRASRTVDGFGFSYRSADNIQLTHTLPVVTRVSWERLYLQPELFGTSSEDNIWSCNGSVEGTAALILNITSGGVLKLYGLGNFPQVYPGDLIATGPTLVIGTWYKIDIRIQFAPPGAISGSRGRADLYVNGVLYGGGYATSNGLNTSQNHATSSIGAISAATSHNLECNIDDWTNSAEHSYIDASGASQLAPGNDLTSGSHIALARPAAFGATHSSAAWLGAGTAVVGDYREINILPANASTSGATVGLVSTTAAARLEALTDYARQQYGVACIAVGAFPVAVSGVAGSTLGITTALGTVATVVTYAASTWTSLQPVYSIPSGATVDALPDIGTLTINAVMGSGAGTNQFVSLFAACEFIGVFGSEDTPPLSPSTVGPRAGIHNHPYPTLHANHAVVGPLTAVRVSAGLYTGNNIGADVFDHIAPQWLFIRALTGTNNGVFWTSSMMAAHKQTAQKFEPSMMPQARLDSSGVAKLQVAGSSPDNNASGTIYQYVAISDIGMRFLLNGAFAHKSTIASAVNALICSGFTPDAAFFTVESYSTAAVGNYYKGPGHTLDNASPFDAAEVSGVATLSAGSITSKTPINLDTPQTAYSVWRKNDGTAQAQWFDVTSYVGNGSGVDRDIPVALNGKAPLFALVIPHDGGSFYRDPSFTGTTCGRINAATSTTGIVGGGINKITVNTALNTNLIVYDVFVIGGSSTAWSNGTFTPAVERQSLGCQWSANPAVVTISPVVLTVPAQWRLHRFDIKPSRQETS